MKIVFRTTESFMAHVRTDLIRTHAFAAERVGFITVRAAQGHEHLVLLAQDYHPVADGDYVDDPSVGAMIGQEALRKALEIALLNPIGIFHVHMHTFPGRVWFSRTDLSEQLRFVPDFFKVRPSMPHGAIVLSPNSVAGRAWLSPSQIVPITEFNVVDSQIKVTRSSDDGSVDYYA